MLRGNNNTDKKKASLVYIDRVKMVEFDSNSKYIFSISIEHGGKIKWQKMEKFI